MLKAVTDGVKASMQATAVMTARDDKKSMLKSYVRDVADDVWLAQTCQNPLLICVLKSAVKVLLHTRMQDQS